MARLDRLLSLGQSETLPDRLARHVRVTNALALVGVVLSLTGTPIDAIGAPLPVVFLDLAAVAAFASCWPLNARGRHTASRVVLMLTANLVMLGGVVQIGGAADLRTIFFPLVILPFLVFSIAERGWLLAFIAIPIVSYFTTGQVDTPPPGLALEIDMIYAPVLSFVLLVTGTYVFASIDRDADEKVLYARARAANSARLAALGEMSGGVAHEIRNPLAAINLAAGQIAEHPEDSAQVGQLAERIQRVVMRATKIIEVLRSFSRDASADPFVPVTVERIVNDTLELCGKRIAEDGLLLDVGTIPPDLVVECRAVQVAQVLMNLIGNAFDAVATVPDRWVRIDARQDGEYVEIAVTDSGPGVPAAARPRLFEPFFTTKPPDRGTGLGLSLSRNLVEAHRGTLDLDTSSSHTRFVIRIPRTQPPDAADRRS
ncbi:MAG TPA: ATP-binding protein [Kofleriaceae bacterium]|nr:ATP-binding protein [Kofleriaceae bacterium]